MYAQIFCENDNFLNETSFVKYFGEKLPRMNVSHILEHNLTNSF